MKILKNIKQPILITGATGFVGSNLLRFFVSKNIKVNILIRKSSNLWRIKDILHKSNFYHVDLNDNIKLAKKIRKIKPKTIFHLAAHGAYSSQNNMDTIKSTVLDGTINSFINKIKINLINYCVIHNGKFYKVFIKK